MSKRRGSAFLSATALIAGVAIGYCLGPSGGDAQERPRESSAGRVVRRPPADEGALASVKALRARIAELERALARRDAEVESASANAVTNAVPVARMPWEGGRGNPREWMEEIRKNDPARYAQMTNSFERMRRWRAERQRRNLDFLASIDTSHMSDRAKKTHSDLLAAITDHEALAERLRQVNEDENATDADREEAFKSIADSDRRLRRLRREERANLFEATAKTLGFEGEDANEIVTTLKEVVEATDDGRGPRGRMPPPPR